MTPLEQAEADADVLAAILRDAQETLARRRGRGAGWEALTKVLHPEGVNLGDVMHRSLRRARLQKTREQHNPRFGKISGHA